LQVILGTLTLGIFSANAIALDSEYETIQRLAAASRFSSGRHQSVPFDHDEVHGLCRLVHRLDDRSAHNYAASVA